MATEQTAAFEKQPMWAGGRSPFNVSYGKLMMWIFLLSDAFTFSSLLVQYGAQRFSNIETAVTTQWPDPASIFSQEVEATYSAKAPNPVVLRSRKS